MMQCRTITNIPNLIVHYYMADNGLYGIDLKCSYGYIAVSPNPRYCRNG